MNYLDLDAIKYDPLSVNVGDKIHINGREYLISEISYKGGGDYVATARFEADAIVHWPPSDEIYRPYESHIRIETLLPEHYCTQQKEEEISDDTRKKFVKLLTE